MAGRSDHGQASTALTLLLLLAGQEVIAMRDRVQANDRSDSTSVNDGTNTKSSHASVDVWDDLKVASSQDAKNARCAQKSERLYEKAFLSMTTTMDKMADTCEEAKEAGYSKCMGRSSGISTTKVMRQAYRFQSLTRKFSDCDWARQFAIKHKAKNEGLGPKLNEIYQKAPEFQKIREQYPDINFAGFVAKIAAVEDGNQAENTVLGALSSSFGFAGTAEDTTNAFNEAQESNMGPDDVRSTSADKNMDDLVDDLEPEWCYRQHRWFSHNSGCSNGGYWGTESCFSFTGGNYNSEHATAKHQTKPQDHLAEDAVLVLNKASSDDERISGGYLKSNKHTWGVCLPKDTPLAQINRINEVRANTLESARVTVNTASESSTALLQVNGTSARLENVLQRVKAGTITKAEFFGYIFQIPALILLGALYTVAFAVFIPIWAMQLVVAGISYPLKILGNLGKLIRFVLAIPVCIVGSLFQIVYEWIKTIFDGLYWLGSKLGGWKLPNATDPEETYMGNVCNLFRNGYFAKDVAPHIEAHA